jgi:hypothetical protein
MPLGPFPYKAKVTDATPTASGDTTLHITVFDNSGTVRSVSQYTLQSQTLQDSTAVRQLLDVMLDLAVQQFLADAGDFITAITSVSVNVGG